MTNSILQRAIGLAVAVSTTFVLFSAVLSLVDSDKASLQAAQSARGTQVAQVAAAPRH